MSGPKFVGHARRGALLALLALTVPGCELLGGLQVERVASSYETPSQVAAYLTIERRGVGMSGLTQGQIRVFEDDQDVTEASQVTLLDRELVAYHHTVLLVDLSKQDEVIIEVMKEAARRLAQTRDVTVLGFDGKAEPFLIGAVPKGQIPALTPPDVARDGSRDLNGAMVATLTRLTSVLSGVSRPIRRGSVLVITRGADLARRVPQEALSRELDRTPHQVFALLAGLELDQLGRELGRTGRAQVDPELDIYAAADQLLNEMEQKLASEYLISYCSPARAGTRLVRIEVTLADEERERRGDVEFEINAAGFGPGCDATRTPTSLKVVAQAAPADDAPSAPVKAPAPSAAPKPDAPATPPEQDIVPPPATPDYAP